MRKSLHGGKRIKERKQKQLVFVLSVITLCCLFIGERVEKTLLDAVVIERYICDRYFVPQDFTPETEEAGEIPLDFVREGTPVAEVEVNTVYPAYQNNGATLYFYENNYNMIYTDFREQIGRKKIAATNGTLFSEQTMETVAKDVMMVRISESDVCINLLPIILEGKITAEILPNSIVRFEEKKIQVFEYYRGRLRQRILFLTGDTHVRVGETSHTYYEWRCYLEKTDKTEAVKEPERREEGFYFYDDEQRYELVGESTVRRVNGDRITLENNGIMYDVDNVPLYFSDENAILLPGRFAIVRPLVSKMNSFPEFSKIYLYESVVYLKNDQAATPLMNAVVYDRDGHFVLTEAGELIVGKHRYSLSPLSMISIEGEQKLSFYDYETKEFKSFYVQGQRAKIEIAKNVVLLPLEYAIQRYDRETEILVREPAMLPLYR